MNNQAGGSAYPHENHLSHRGMSLRDYFAAKAMQSFINGASGVVKFGVDHPETNLGYARAAYTMADAMLKVRNG